MMMMMLVVVAVDGARVSSGRFKSDRFPETKSKLELSFAGITVNSLKVDWTHVIRWITGNRHGDDDDVRPIIRRCPLVNK